MRLALPLWTLIVSAALVAACSGVHLGAVPAAANGRQPDIQQLAEALDAIARGESTVTEALSPLVELPHPAQVRAPGNIRLPGFQDAAGHVVRKLELRVRRDGIDSSRFILAHVEPQPCVDLETLAARVGATESRGIPPSPHAPIESRSPGVRGYAADYGNQGEFRIWASQDAPNCATLITAQQPAYRGEADAHPND